MRNRDFKAIHKQLLRGGIAPEIANRASREFRDHYLDLVEEAQGNGASLKEARAQAGQCIGNDNDFVSAMLSRSELKSWPFRFPRLALVVYPLACLVSIPAIPVFRGVEHAPTIARWGASLIGAGAVTVALLLAMQVSILFG